MGGVPTVLPWENVGHGPTNANFNQPRVVISNVGRPIAMLWAIMTPPLQGYKGTRSLVAALARDDNIDPSGIYGQGRPSPP